MKTNLKIILSSSILFLGCSGTVPQLGIEAGELKKCPESPNCVNSQAKDEEHSIEPIVLLGSPQEVKNVLESSINSFDNSKITFSDSSYIRAEFTSSIFRFVDDVEFYFPSEGEGETTVHLRSASRLGHSDLGVNRERIEKIRTFCESLKK